jgi:hypothetical protein
MAIVFILFIKLMMDIPKPKAEISYFSSNIVALLSTTSLFSFALGAHQSVVI